MMTDDGNDAERAHQLHRRATVIDTHCDTTHRLAVADWDLSARHEIGHVDIPRLRDGGVNAIFFAVWASGLIEKAEGMEEARRQIDRIHRAVNRHVDDLLLARTAADIRAAQSAGKIAICMAIEGGHLIGDSLDVLREYHAQGATYLTLTHAHHTSWADSSGVHERLAPRHGGLTALGREVIAELNRLGMMVDISHVSDETFWNVIEASAAPVVATHSSCRSVSPHRRNLTDDMMRAIAESGGTVQINFAAGFLDPDHPPIDPTLAERMIVSGDPLPPSLAQHFTPLELLVDHFDHALRVVGAEHVGIGSDFDGVPTVPKGMEDCSKLPMLTAALLGRGYTELELTQVLGGNVLRVMEACEKIAGGQRADEVESRDTRP